MRRKQTALILAIVLVGSTLSAVVAYRFGLHRGRQRTGASHASYDSAVFVPGPCVLFSDAEPLVGKQACVTGRILRVYTSRAGNTFLDFCPDYRKCPFASVIFSEDRDKFGDLGQVQGRQVEIRGLVSHYQGRSEIIIRDPQQIRVLP